MIEGSLDGSPQIGPSAEIGFVAVKSNRAHPVPGLCEAVERMLQDAGDLQIPFRVRIGDETVIEIHAASGVGGRFRGAVRYA